jgi:hypothetical protein
MAVYLACAKATKQPFNNEFAGHVMLVVEAAGGVPIKPMNRHLFAGMKEREADWTPRNMSPQELGRLRRAFYARLAQEGLGDIEAGSGRKAWLPTFDAFRAELNQGFFDAARADYWARKRELEVWGLYALEGLTIRDICARLDMKRDKVHRIITAMRKGANIGHRGKDQETSDAEEEQQDLDDQ